MTDENDNSKVKKKPIKIECRAVFVRIVEIDSKNEKFEADVIVECSWLDDKLFKALLDPDLAKKQTKGYVETKNANFTDFYLKYLLKNIDEIEYDTTKFWSPEIFVENSISTSENIKYRMEIVEKDKSFFAKLNSKSQSKYANKPINVVNNLTVKVIEMRRIKGIFYERLELNDFPIDLQEISIRLSSKKSVNEVILVENKHELSRVDINNFCDGQQYDLFDHVNTKTDCFKDDFRKMVRPQFVASAFVVRKFGFYVYNAYTLIFLITMLGFTAFSFNPGSPQFRCQVTGLLLLTLVNFRWIITQRLPSVSYLTLLDKYSIGSITILFSFFVWHSIIGSKVISSNSQELYQIDYYVLYGFVGFYVLFNLIFIIWFFKLFASVKIFEKKTVKKSPIEDEKEKLVKSERDDGI